jgi:dimethylhistidine N-methyltransferase
MTAKKGSMASMPNAIPRRRTSSISQARSPRIVRRLAHDPTADAQRLLDGLLRKPAQLEPKYFYDAQGSALFSAICELDEYYPAHAEKQIFQVYRDSILARLPRRAQWIDLGCGDGKKSRNWLPLVRPRRFVGIDCAEGWLRETVVGIAADYPGLEVVGVTTDLSDPPPLASLLAERPECAPIFFYPGSSIGNFTPDRARELLRSLCHLSGNNGVLLIGIDLIKDKSTLHAAYDDALGVSAAFNRNILRVVNRHLGADLNPARFAHQAVVNEALGRVEMQLVATERHNVRFTAPRLSVRSFDAGECITTEYSYKYSIPGFAALLANAGFSRQNVWTNSSEGYAVFLAAP